MTYPQRLTDDASFDLHWQMTNCERFALQGLLQRLSPSVSIEIGTYQGGSLQVISRYSDKVISIDIDPEVGKRLDGKFPNVEYRSGDSAELLPGLVEQLNHDGTPVGFILVDGDHSSAGVRRDINYLLALKPIQRIVIIMHDSFNPTCREGMRTASWEKSPYVSWVELDFIPGIYHREAHDTAPARSMWGGFACAVLEPVKRTGALVIKESQRGLFDSTYAHSVHAEEHTLSQRLKIAARRIKRRLLRS
jgi:hypothetical protein